MDDTADTQKVIMNLTRPHEADFWCLVLGVDASELRAAVSTVGPMLSNVNLHLRQCAAKSSRQVQAATGEPLTGPWA